MHETKVPSAEFIKNYGELIDKAWSEPITITCNDRDRLVVLSVDEYQRLKRRDRRVATVGEFTPEEMEAISRAEVPAEHAILDEDLRDWLPVSVPVPQRSLPGKGLETVAYGFLPLVCLRAVRDLMTERYRVDRRIAITRIE